MLLHWVKGGVCWTCSLISAGAKSRTLLLPESR
jgi:hypothetical protein